MGWSVSINRVLLSMGDPRVKATTKVFLDVLVLVVVLSTYWVYAFRYMKDFYLTPLEADYEFVYEGMDAYVRCSYSEFDDHFCSNSTSPAAEVCSNRGSFFAAGLTYVLISALSLLFLLYSLLHTLSYACVCTCWGLLSLSVLSYLYTPLYFISVLLYCVISGVFSLSPGDKWPSSYDMEMGPGLALMFAGCFLSLLSLSYYIYAKRSGLTAFMDAVSEEPELLNPQPKAKL